MRDSGGSTDGVRGPRGTHGGCVLWYRDSAGLLSLMSWGEGTLWDRVLRVPFSHTTPGPHGQWLFQVLWAQRGDNTHFRSYSEATMRGDSLWDADPLSLHIVPADSFLDYSHTIVQVLGAGLTWSCIKKKTSYQALSCVLCFRCGPWGTMSSFPGRCPLLRRVPGGATVSAGTRRAGPSW